MNIKSSLFQIAITSGCLVGMVDTAFAARISAVAKVTEQLDTQASSTPGASVVAFISTPSLAEAESQVGFDFTLRVRSFSNAAGRFAGIATNGLATSPFVINGNPNNVELPLCFNFSPGGNTELTPTYSIFSGAGGWGGSVRLFGGSSALTSRSGTLLMGTNCRQGYREARGPSSVTLRIVTGKGNVSAAASTAISDCQQPAVHNRLGAKGALVPRILKN